MKFDAYDYITKPFSPLQAQGNNGSYKQTITVSKRSSQLKLCTGVARELTVLHQTLGQCLNETTETPRPIPYLPPCCERRMGDSSLNSLPAVLEQVEICKLSQSAAAIAATALKREPQWVNHRLCFPFIH